MNKIEFAGLSFTGLLFDNVSLCPSAGFKWVVTVNSDFIYRANKSDSRLRKIINNNVSTLDGALPFYCAKVFYPYVDFNKISGSDLIYRICEEASDEKNKIMIFGGDSDSNYLATGRLRAIYPNLNVESGQIGYSGYPFNEKWLASAKALIEASRPTVFVCCLGSPKQEYFIEENREFLMKLGVRYAIGAGGTVDFLAGKVKRAPRLYRILCLEGVYRFFVEPSSMRFKRLLSSAAAIRYFWIRRQRS